MSDKTVNVIFKMNVDSSGAVTGVKHVTDEIHKTEQQIDKTTKKTNEFSSGLKKVGAAIGAYMAIDKLKQFIGSIITLRSEYEKFAAVLKTSLGSEKEAAKSMKMIQEFAAKTPFSVQQLTGGFVKLVNQGFKPTLEQMTNLGDLASSTGKDFDQLAEAVIDAQVGEFERLKEFGIKASVSGDKVKLTFKGVTQEIDKSSKSIQEAIINYGKMNGVMGSMDAISKTLGGKISNLGDAWDTLLINLGSGDNLGGIFDGAIDSANELLTSFNDLIKAKPSDALVEEYAKVNKLAFQYEQTTTSLKGLITGYNDRKNIILELQAISPAYFGDLDTEKAKVEDVTAAIALYNVERQQSIIKQVQKENIQDLSNDLALYEKKFAKFQSQTISDAQTYINDLVAAGKPAEQIAQVQMLFNKLTANFTSENYANYIRFLTDEKNAFGFNQTLGEARITGMSKNLSAFQTMLGKSELELKVAQDNLKKYQQSIGFSKEDLYKFGTSGALSVVDEIAKNQQKTSAVIKSGASTTKSNEDKLAEELQRIREENFKKSLSLKEQEIFEENKKYDELIKLAKGNVEKIIEINELRKTALLEIDNKYYILAEEDNQRFNDLLTKQNKEFTTSELQRKVDALNEEYKKLIDVEIENINTNEEIKLQRIKELEALKNKELLKLLDESLSAGAPETPVPLPSSASVQSALLAGTGGEEMTLDKEVEIWNKRIDVAEQATEKIIDLYDERIRKEQELINIQERKVSEAYELTKTGNVQQYKLEKERLERMYEEQAKAMKRKESLVAFEKILSTTQVALNTAVAVSKSAAEGGILAPITIGITLASIIAGIGASLGIASAIQGFKDGGFTGEGNPNESAGIVHKGEFVFNAQTTKQNRPFLEAMQNQRQPLDKYIQSIVVNQNQNSFNGMESRLDRIERAITGQQFGLNIDGQTLNSHLTRINKNANRLISKLQ